MTEARVRVSESPPARLGIALSIVAPATADHAARRAGSLPHLRADLLSLSDELFSTLDDLSTALASTPSLCEGWSVLEVVLHLAVGDELAVSALGGHRPFPVRGSSADNLDAFARDRVAASREQTLDAARTRFWMARRALLDAVGPEATTETKVPWVAGPVSIRALLSSRLMETWIHGWDIRWPLGIKQPVDDRAVWIVDLTLRTLPYALNRSAVISNPFTVTAQLDGVAGVSRVVHIPGSDGSPPSAADSQVALSGPAWAVIILGARRPAPVEGWIPPLRIVGSGPTGWLQALRSFA